MKKKSFIFLLLGFFAWIFVVSGVFKWLAIPSFDGLFTTIFGESNDYSYFRCNSFFDYLDSYETKKIYSITFY